MSSINDSPSDTKGTIKVGLGVGLIAGVALFATFLSVDQQLGLPHGLFFKTMDAAFGVEPVLAIFLGICASAVIGVVYNLISENWKTFRIITTPKGILTGAVGGAIVFGLVFVPLHALVFVPAIDANVLSNGSDDFSEKEIKALTSLLINNTHVLWYGAFVHVVFGSILGLMSGFVLADRYTGVKRIRSFW